MADLDSKMDRAIGAIKKVVDLFCSRCVIATESLDKQDYDRFNEYFQLQRMAWANLDAMVSKFEKDFGSASAEQVSARRVLVRAWILPCQESSRILQQRITQAMTEIEERGRAAGRLKVHLGAFQSAFRDEVRFLKGA